MIEVAGGWRENMIPVSERNEKNGDEKIKI
jgi:hypothetical protein